MSETVWQGKFLRVVDDGGWEYAARTGDLNAVVIVAVDDGHLVLIEQYRIPAGRRVLELPAGVVGDDSAGETPSVAAIRELDEETGYRAAAVEDLGHFYASPGMTSEGFTLMRATGLTRSGPGGGTAAEDITVHRVPLTELGAFIAGKRRDGIGIDARLLLFLPVLA